MREHCEHCGAKLITSSKGNLYCPKICWKKPEVIAKEKLQRELDAVIMEYRHGDWGDRDA